MDEVRTHREWELAELARRQHGVVTTAQLEALGFVRTTIAHWAKVGRLHRLHRGVYALGHTALTWDAHCLAAVLARPGSVASHRTAAWIHGLLRYRPEKIHLTAPTRQRAKRDFVVHFARLEPEDRCLVDGIPVTSPARTVLDLAAKEPRQKLDRLLERANERRLLDRRRFEALAARAGGHPGRAKFATALAAYRPEPAVLRSDLEKRFRRLVIRAGLPRPQTNVVVEGYELDAYWETEGFAVELDVYATHGSPRSFEADRERADDLLLAGIELIRVTNVRLDREPRETVVRVAAHLARRRRTSEPRRSVA
ncbi:MAG TPA: type IV toxin-antitoxin system AbiEi family antitoxin domain-containing protein [Solirubrobacterales bacterium]|nr:type IV toxin-antitoxin system AbiEi family antitoxin domain-containing protein [Solirubrobacterales bacterium]